MRNQHASLCRCNVDRNEAAWKDGPFAVVLRQVAIFDIARLFANQREQLLHTT